MNNPSISLDLTKSGIDSLVVCERHNYRGTAVGPISGDTEILVGINGLHITATLADLVKLAADLSHAITELPQRRQRDHEWWAAHAARKAQA